MMIRVLLLSFGVVLLDQATKAFMVRSLAGVPTFPVLPGLFHLTLIRNPGVAFGLFSGYSLPVALVTTTIVVMLLWSTLKEKSPDRWLTTGLGLILGGAVGNLIDRARIGGVIDFLDFRIWPVFNVADSCITIGAVLIAWSLLRKK